MRVWRLLSFPSLFARACPTHSHSLYFLASTHAPFPTSPAWKATAIGKGFAGAKSFLEKRYHEEIELEDAIHTAILTLKESFVAEMNKDNVEIALVEGKGQFRVLTPEEVQDYLDETE